MSSAEQPAYHTVMQYVRMDPHTLLHPLLTSDQCISALSTKVPLYDSCPTLYSVLTHYKGSNFELTNLEIKVMESRPKRHCVSLLVDWMQPVTVLTAYTYIPYLPVTRAVILHLLL